MKTALGIISMCLFNVLSIQQLKAYTPDSTAQKCFHYEVQHTQSIIHYLESNHIDSIELLYGQLPNECTTKGWNQLIKLFLVCVKYPERIIDMPEPDMEFLIDYTYSIKHNKIKYLPKDSIYYFYRDLVTFNSLHPAVQKYLNTFYTTLEAGTKQQMLVGTLLNKNNLFFEHLNATGSQYNYIPLYASFTANKKKLGEMALLFLNINTSYSTNKQLGNFLLFEPFSIEVIDKRTMFGASFGFGIQKSEVDYQITYNNQAVVPKRGDLYSFSGSYNYILLKKGAIKPYIGLGVALTWQYQETPEVNGKRDDLTVCGRQMYPEFGFLIGKRPNYWAKIHCSYRYTMYTVDYSGDEWNEDQTNSTFGHNLIQNEIRFGVSILFDLFKETTHKGKMVGSF